MEPFEQDEQARSAGYQLNVLANGLHALSNAIAGPDCSIEHLK